MSLQEFLVRWGRRPWILGLWLGLAFLGLVLPGLERSRLQEVDELTHAKVAQNAALRGHWNPLWLDNHPFYEKPPLLPWLCGLTVKVSGRPYASWPYRLWPALGAAALLALLAAGVAACTGQVLLAVGAVLLLAVQPDFIFHARFLSHDTLFVASALATLALAARAVSRGPRAWLGPGLALGLAFAFKSWFVLSLLPALVWALFRTVPRSERPAALLRLSLPSLLLALAWLALYTRWLGPEFLRQEWQSNLWGRAMGRTTGLDPEGQFSFYVKWARWSAPALTLWALALPLGWRPLAGRSGRAFLEQATWALALSWVLALCVLRAQTINYLLPLETALVLALALAWDRWSWAQRRLAGLGFLLSALALTRQGPYAWPVVAGLALGLALRFAPNRPPDRGGLNPGLAWALLLALSLSEAQGMLYRPLDAHAQLAELLRQHPARVEGEPLWAFGPQTQAVDFYSSYQVRWFQALPARRPTVASLVKAKDGWRFYEASGDSQK